MFWPLAFPVTFRVEMCFIKLSFTNAPRERRLAHRIDTEGQMVNPCKIEALNRDKSPAFHGAA